MISHVFIGVTNFPAALDFYSGIMAELGLVLKFSDTEKSWAGWVASNAARPLFVIGKPYDGADHNAGNGQMVALLARSRDEVGRVYAKALSSGGTCEGMPGLRPEYHADYFGAYFRDHDGNKICVCCHAPASIST